MPNLKKILKPTNMNNNKTQQTNQPNPNRFHLKTWQWLPVLILATAIVGGVFIILNRGTQVAPREVIITTEEKVDDLDLAREALIEYFSLLNEGKYTEAVKYHGSGYDYIQHSCPKIDLSNYAGLLECGCGFLVCEKIKNIVSEKVISPEEFEFTVQFIYDDGVLEGETVKSYPYCCGEEPPEGVANIPNTEFEYRVKKISANFFVITPLLYIP